MLSVVSRQHTPIPIHIDPNHAPYVSLLITQRARLDSLNLIRRGLSEWIKVLLGVMGVFLYFP